MPNIFFFILFYLSFQLLVDGNASSDKKRGAYFIGSKRLCSQNQQSSTSGTYAYALPLLVATLAYLDLRFTIAGNVIAIAANVVRLLIHYDPNNQELLASNVLAIFVLCLVAYTSIRVTRLLLSFNRENLQGLETAAQI